mmetsp:Transcript_122066/g.237345  ORF Transcript_122066/g.237345 Transcript_122066/m.237345 type:complete len:226 (-) Transcript_122066:1055-1732(-)
MLGAGQMLRKDIEDVEMAQKPYRKKGQEARNQLAQGTPKPVHVERPIRKCLLKLQVRMAEDPRLQALQHPFPEENEDGDKAHEQTLDKSVLITITPPFLPIRMYVAVEVPCSSSKSIETVLNCHGSGHDLSVTFLGRFVLGINSCLFGVFQFPDTCICGCSSSFGFRLHLFSGLASFLSSPARCRVSISLCLPRLSREFPGFLLNLPASCQCCSPAFRCLLFCLD